ncbi:34286_t:CDS:2, partial [Gigaspora margarita]
MSYEIVPCNLFDNNKVENALASENLLNTQDSFDIDEIEDVLTDENIPSTTAKDLLGAEFENYDENLPLIDTPFELKVGTQFPSMLVAVHFVEQYARQNRFATYKHKGEKFKDGTWRKRVLKCDLGGRYNERLLKPALGKQKNKGSKKQGCKWQINITRPLDSSIVTITTFNNEHNHELSAETLKFAVAYKTFSQEIMDQIEFYVVYGRCDAATIRNLLQPKYPDRVFLTQDLGNAIQKVKREKGLNLGDAASLLMKLFELQAHDPACIQRSHCESVFERRSQELAEKYAAGERYIKTMLLNRKHTWVKCFTSRHFTAGTQSTQRVESENALIQKAVHSSFSLLEVQEVLEKRLEFESINN